MKQEQLKEMLSFEKRLSELDYREQYGDLWAHGLTMIEINNSRGGYGA